MRERKRYRKSINRTVFSRKSKEAAVFTARSKMSIIDWSSNNAAYLPLDIVREDCRRCCDGNH